MTQALYAHMNNKKIKKKTKYADLYNTIPNGSIIMQEWRGERGKGRSKIRKVSLKSRKQLGPHIHSFIQNFFHSPQNIIGDVSWKGQK
jgi:hypothetical protein